MVGEDHDLEDRIRAYAEALPAGRPVTLDQARARAIALWTRRRRRRRLMIAAVVTILLAAAVLLVRTGLADDGVAAERPDPRDLGELADRVADLPPTTVLGASDEARYTYRRVTRSTDRPGSEATSTTEETWVSIDGAAGPDPFTVDGVPLRTFLQLPDDVDAVEAAFTTDGRHGFTPEVAPALVDALGYTGLPGPARAGALRALDRLGMATVSDADPGPHLLRVAGPGGRDGSTLQADVDLRTGMVVAWELYGADGGITRVAIIEVDLRRDGPRGP